MRARSLPLLTCLATLHVATTVTAHPAHETHAEMAWNSKASTFEIALKVRGIDLEAALSKGNGSGKRIDLAKSSDADSRITNYLKSHFVVKGPDSKSAKLTFVGKEVDERTAWLYFEYALPGRQDPTGCTVTNRMLFGTLDGQINKVDWRVEKESRILTFNEQTPTVALDTFYAKVPRAKWTPPLAMESLPSIKSLPDLFKMADGQRVESISDWNARRREMIEMIQHYAYGRMPPRPDSIAVEAPKRKPSHNGLGIREQMVLSIGSEHQLKLHVSIHFPPQRIRNRHPVIIANVHRITELPCIEMFLQNGYAFAQYQREDLAPDQPDTVGPAQAAYPDHDWATLAVWAWGGMRVVDYLESRDDIDLERLAITGHSRGGKAALLAGALDERFSMVAPNGSGCGGAGCFRGTTSKSESLAEITDPTRFGYWFHPRLRWFANREDRLPFDQHFLKALAAPRALLCTEARGDLWANPSGTRRTSVAARDAYSFLGVKDRIGLVYREGQHDQTLEDWTRLLEFAQWQFYDKVPGNDADFWQSP